MNKILLLACALACSPVAFGQLYKSIDKDGRVVYSDQPPANANAQQLKVSPGPAPAAPPTAKERGKEQEKGKAAAAEKAKEDELKAKQAKANQERCEVARTQLRNFDAGGRFLVVDAKGERNILDEKQVEEERAKAQKAIDESCKAS
jgi:hypothetical protein